MKSHCSQFRDFEDFLVPFYVTALALDILRYGALTHKGERVVFMKHQLHVHFDTNVKLIKNEGLYLSVERYDSLSEIFTSETCHLRRKPSSETLMTSFEAHTNVTMLRVWQSGVGSENPSVVSWAIHKTAIWI